MTKKVSFIIILALVIPTMFYFDLFNPYNFLSGTIDRLNEKLIYPQCEFEGIELEKLNAISSEMGFSVVHVDCQAFYTKGMNTYNRIMDTEISKINGKNWMDKLYKNMKINLPNIE